VTLAAGPESRRYEVDVVRELGEHATYLTCSATRPSRPRRHRATAMRALPR
jgi:hypothetical protein